MKASHNLAALGDDLARLGLRSGQARTRTVARNCEWYDRYGNRLGYGDLNTVDLKRIAAELGPEDLFLAIEHESAGASVGSAAADYPKVETLIARSSYAMTRGRVCRIVDGPAGGVTVLDGQLMLWPLSRRMLRLKWMEH